MSRDVKKSFYSDRVAGCYRYYRVIAGDTHAFFEKGKEGDSGFDMQK